VKELRYVLQLAKDSDSKFIKALGEAKDAIGAWHDWMELEAVATKVLDHSGGCNVLKEIHSTAQVKLNHACQLPRVSAKNSCSLLKSGVGVLYKRLNRHW
jgi:hypothetical protein